MPESQIQGPGSASGGEVRTFLIADVRGYTRYTLEHGDEAAAELAAGFAHTAREVVGAHEGEVLELRGDEALAVFTSARQALRAAVALQERFVENTSASGIHPYKVGIGLDSGEAVPLEGGYRGAALNLAARLCSLAGAGEVLASESVTHLARKLPELHYVERGAVQLKGFFDPVRVIEVTANCDGEPAESAGAVRADRPLPIGGFLGALPSTPLVARQQELQTVLDVVDVVAGGSGRLVLLSGEPGVGKTRLAQEVTLQLRDRGFRAASGRCYETQETVPFYPLLEAIGVLYATAPAPLREAVPQRWPYLTRLLPGISLAAPQASSGGDEERERLLWTVTAFVQALAEAAPVALLLDDLHWADASSLALLQHLARHTRAHRVLMLGTYRDTEIRRQHPLELALRDLHREALLDRVAVRRMEQAGTAALIADAFGQPDVSEEFVATVHRHTEGNPFFTQEVLQALVERGDIYQEYDRWERREIQDIEVPESVRSTIGERLSRLRDPTQEVLRRASVFGQVFHFDDLAALSELSEEETEQAIEEASGIGLIRETIRDHYGFNHALTQATLYSELSGRRKRRLHLAAGEVLERSHRSPGLPAAELVRHFIEGDDPQRALQYALRAGRDAQEVFAHDEAQRHYRVALDLTQEIEAPEMEAEAALNLGTLLQLNAEFEESATLLERALKAYASVGNRVMEARAAVEIVTVYGFLDRITERDGALAHAEDLVAALADEKPTRELCLVYQQFVGALLGNNKLKDVISVGERELEIATALGDQRLTHRAHIDRISGMGAIGRMREALQQVESLLPDIERSGDAGTLTRALFEAAEYAMLAGEFQKSRTYRERELIAATRVGDVPWTRLVRMNLAQLSLYMGEWETALDFVEQARTTIGTDNELSTDTGNFTDMVRGAVHLLRGQIAEAMMQWKRLTDPLQVHLPQLAWYVQRDLAAFELLNGRPEDALERLERLLQISTQSDAEGIYTFPILAWAYLETGQVERAREVVEQVREQASADGYALALVDALRVHGMVLARIDRQDDAGRAFEQAVSLARSMPYPYIEALALSEWGRMLRAQGADPAGRNSLQSALEIFQRLGAQPDVERTERALRAD